MANKKSRFPSYGLVRGPSHEQGGVAGMVADEQPVELEGGEWIIPKEVVPDYLPVLKQITNEGRAIQKMDTGNTAMDALIASASLQTGLAQPKSPMYQEGGEVSFLEKLPLIGPQLKGYREYQEADRYIDKRHRGQPLFSEDTQRSGIQVAGETRREVESENDKAIKHLFNTAMVNYDPEETSRGIARFSKSDSGESALKKLLIGTPSGYRVSEDDRLSYAVDPENIARVTPGKKLLGMFPVGYSGSVEPNVGTESQLDFSNLEALKSLAGYKQGGPVYQEGGNVLKLRTDTYTPKEVAQLDSISALMDSLNTKWVQDYGGDYQSRMARYGYPNYGLPEEEQTADKGRWPSKKWIRKSKEAREAFERDKEKASKRIEEAEASMQKVPMKSIDPSGKWGYTPAEHLWSLIEGQGNTAFPGLRLDEVEQPRFQQGGQVLPRKQQEMRNPTVYGPPIELMGPMPADTSAVDTTDDEFQHLLNQLRMRDVNQNINPFTGDTIDTYLDSLRLQQRMKKSKIPQSAGRKKARQGGPVMYQEGGMVQGGQALERRPSESMGDASFDNSLMGSIGMDRRVKPVDRYTIKGGEMTSAEMEIPKLSTAYLASFGMETPLSKRQQALLFRKGIAPQTLNPQVKGLINRALVQRLTNEED